MTSLDVDLDRLGAVLIRRRWHKGRFRKISSHSWNSGMQNASTDIRPVASGGVPSQVQPQA